MRMKATDLNQALNYVEDAYLLEVDSMEKEHKPMKTKKRAFRILAAAAMIAVLSLTAYAAEQLRISSLVSGRSQHYNSYAQMDQALAKTGLALDIPEEFEAGFRFQGVEVREVKAEDEHGKTAFTFQELAAEYVDNQGQKLRLVAGPNLEGLTETESIPAETRTIGNTVLNYYQDHYLFVPEGYQLSQEELEWGNQPGNYISYGSDQVEKSDPVFLCWKENDIYYFFFDSNGVDREILFSMAEEMIRK